VNGLDWHTGSCHCGRVRFRVRIRSLEAIDCNCSICTKKAFEHLIVPEHDFELETGQDALAEYRFHTGVACHRFCRHCGVHPFYTPRSHPDQVDVNVRCLEPELRAHFRRVAFDGQNWEESVEGIR